MAYFLGIDGGGSKTAALIGNEFDELARAEAPSCKIQSVGEAAARAALKQVVEQVCDRASLKPSDIARVCIGISGASNQEIAARVRQIVGELTRGEVDVVGDNVIALEAAVGSGAGVVVIAGTGSIAYGRNELGEEARAGGFGPVISDEGSGTWIGKRALRAVAATGQEHFALARLLMREWHASRISDLVGRSNAFPQPEFAALFPVVVEACEQHDQMACAVLHEAGRELARLALEVISRLWPDRNDTVKVGMAGGVLRNSLEVRRSFAEALTSQRPEVIVNENIADPAAGALAIARRTQA